LLLLLLQLPDLPDIDPLSEHDGLGVSGLAGEYATLALGLSAACCRGVLIVTDGDVGAESPGGATVRMGIAGGGVLSNNV